MKSPRLSWRPSHTWLKLAVCLTACSVLSTGCSGGEDAVETTTTTQPGVMTPTGNRCSSIPGEGDSAIEALSQGSPGVAIPRINELANLSQALEKAGLIPTLGEDRSFTVFAPSNEAFDRLDSQKREDLLGDQPELARVLNFHIVPGRFTLQEIQNNQELQTLEGSALRLEKTPDQMSIGEANVVCANIGMRNGVVHVIDSVLMPPPKQAS